MKSSNIVKKQFRSIFLSAIMMLAVMVMFSSCSQNNPISSNTEGTENVSDDVKAEANYNSIISKQDNLEQLNKLSEDINMYLSVENSKFLVNSELMRQNGYNDEIIQFVNESYSGIEVKEYENHSLAKTSSIPGTIAKNALKLIRKNWDTILKKMPATLRNIVVKNVNLDNLISVLDWYFGVSDSIENAITDGLRYILPGSFLDWMAPAMAKIIMLYLPI
jgi:hypothetical protein